MESAQRELMRVLLDNVRSLGLITQAAYSHAQDFVYTAADFPEPLFCPACWSKEAGSHGCAENTR